MLPDYAQPEARSEIGRANDRAYENRRLDFQRELEQQGSLAASLRHLYAQQEGLEASAKPGITLGDYQEIRVRHFEQAVDKYMAMEPKLPDWTRLQRDC